MALNGWGSSWLYSQIHQEQIFQLLKWNSHLLKKLFYLLQWKLFKNYEKCFLFDLMFCYWFTSHRGIITRPHFHSCYTINFNDHILSYLFQTKVHLIHFTYWPLLSLPLFTVWFHEIIHHLKLNSFVLLYSLSCVS